VQVNFSIHIKFKLFQFVAYQGMLWYLHRVKDTNPDKINVGFFNPTRPGKVLDFNPIGGTLVTVDPLLTGPRLTDAHINHLVRA
jgi:hypothetical protein